MTVPFNRVIDGALHRARVCDVHDKRACSAPELLEVSECLSESSLIYVAGYESARPLAGEREGARPADPTRGSRDQH
jgi:hypothetical protein